MLQHIFSEHVQCSLLYILKFGISNCEMDGFGVVPKPLVSKAQTSFKSCRCMQKHRSFRETSRYQQTGMTRCPAHPKRSIGRPRKPCPEPDPQTPPSRRLTDIVCLTCSGVTALMQSISNVWLPYRSVNLITTHHGLDQEE